MVCLLIRFRVPESRQKRLLATLIAARSLIPHFVVPAGNSGQPVPENAHFRALSLCITILSSNDVTFALNF
jgi:hypothetical protein